MSSSSFHVSRLQQYSFFPVKKNPLWFQGENGRRAFCSESTPAPDCRGRLRFQRQLNQLLRECFPGEILARFQFPLIEGKSTSVGKRHRLILRRYSPDL